MIMITKQQFDAAYNKYPASKIEEFYFKYFSINTLKEDKWVRKIIIIPLIILFFMGLIGTLVGWTNKTIAIFGVLFSAILAIWVISMFFVVIFHNLRIRKIRMELGGISKDEYNRLVDLFYPNE